VQRVPLTNGGFVLVSDEDEALARQYSWHTNARGYVRSTLWLGGGKTRQVLLHKLLLADAKLVDHRNGDKLDCTRDNLRAATPEENARNRGGIPATSSRYKGVCWNRGCGKWQAAIRVRRTLIHLGVFDDEAAAARAYDAAAWQHFGDFARPNFPEEAPCEV
jgi:hypothetical protein